MLFYKYKIYIGKNKNIIFLDSNKKNNKDNKIHLDINNKNI